MLDALTGVTQGSQTRSFVYDSIGRLTSEATPETANISVYFQYDQFSNLTQKTDARGVITNFVYDTLNRLTQINYNVGSSGVPATPTVNLTYGTNSSLNNNGRLITMTDGTGSENYSYNVLGQVTQLQKVIGSITYTTAFQYNLAGAITQITYPSGRVVEQSFDALGRLCELAPVTSGCGTAANPYAKSFSYNPASQLIGLNYGNGVAAALTYSPDRLQLTSLKYTSGAQTLFGVNYWYKQDATNCASGASGNNGQVQCITDSVDAGRNVSYTYDPTDRIATAVTNGSTAFPKWGLSFVYDRYGNRTQQNVTAGTFRLSTVPNTRRAEEFT